jgi:hypothetical protein
MLRFAKFGPLSMLLFFLTTFITTKGAQSAKGAAVAPGPVPAQINSAKSVFISNAGADCNPSGEFGFSGDSDRAYDDFYAAMKTWGRYSLSAAPSDAELAFEISFACPASGPNADKQVTGTLAYDPQFRLAIVDIKTHVQLWVLIEHVRPALTQGNRDKNFDEAMSRLVGGAKTLAAASGPAAAGAQN